jgi:hypothetical protein
MQATTDKPTLTWENVRHWADASSEHRPERLGGRRVEAIAHPGSVVESM